MELKLNIKNRRRKVKKGLLTFLGVLLVSLASASYAAVDVDKVMVQNIFEDDIGYILEQIALDTGVEIEVDEEIVERSITVDWSEGVTLKEALDYLCGVENVWGVVDDVVMVAPIDEENPTFQKLCGEPVSFTLLYVNSTKEALNLMDDYYARFCKADEERGRIIVHAPPDIRKNIQGYLDVINSPREKVVLKSSTVFIKTSSLGSLGFGGISYEWGSAIPIVDRQFAQIITGIGGIYESDKANKLRLAVDMLVEKGVAVRKANPTVIGEEGAVVEVVFTEKTWQQITLPASKDQYYSYEIKEIEAPITLKATPLVDGDMIALKDLMIGAATFSRTSRMPVINEQIIRTRVTLESGQTIIVGGLTQQTKKNLLKQILPGKKWENEEIEVLIFITPQIWTAELAEKETFLEKILEKKVVVEKQKQLSFGVGSWISASLFIFEGDLFLNKNNTGKLFVGGGKNDDRYLYYGGLEGTLWDLFDLGVGVINSDTLANTEFMLTAGLSIGTDDVRLEGNYFYLPNAQDESGVRVAIEFRF
ncbi:hypothetical protein J7K42_01310 [bacterium]|nr:hypothetical protein [bacterium]